MVRRRSFLLIDPLRPVSGVDDVDEVNAARPSVLYAAMVHRSWPPSSNVVLRRGGRSSGLRGVGGFFSLLESIKKESFVQNARPPALV